MHTLKTTAANVSDITVTSELVRDDDRVLYGDSGYIGAEKRPEIAGDPRLSKLDFRLNRRKCSVKTWWDKWVETQKSSVRSKVEHSFLLVKRLFGYARGVYRGLTKNTNRFFHSVRLSQSSYVCSCRKAGKSCTGTVVFQTDERSK